MPREYHADTIDGEQGSEGVMATVHYEDRMRTRPPSGEPVSPMRGLSPERTVLHGDYCTLETLDPARHAGDLFAASHGQPGQQRLWDYLPAGPFPDFSSFTQWVTECAASSDPLFYAIRDRTTGRTTGMASYLNIHPGAGSIEIGHIMFGSPLQKTPAATEALFLLMDYAMTELSYRRLEWKCNALNAPSRKAANRLGFRYEGTFYQHLIVKGHNRDTAWYSILDREWPRLRANFEQWLAAENFDRHGWQRVQLSELNKPRDE
ncbi:MAG: GNAT family N-acetyltransferase [Thermomicrobiales bacterium]|nr:GNAT family N-acetyltransferase [Thermomicrobiales bacterium]MCO5222704.1 GNAT family N-acetyltransferase [Thermomicrobiales bacterium]